MSCLFCSDLRLEEASAKPEVTDQVKKLVSCALVGEAELKVAQVSVFTHFERRDIEKTAHVVHLFLCDRMLYDHNRIVHVTTLYKTVVEEELYLVEEDECPQTPISSGYTTEESH